MNAPADRLGLQLVACAAGSAATYAALAAAGMWLGLPFASPDELVRGLLASVPPEPMGVALCASAVACAMSVIWGPVALWISRDRSVGPDATVGPARMTAWRLMSVVTVVPVLVALTWFLLALIWFAGRLGPVAIAILMPAALLGGLFATVLVIGMLSFPLMPATVAIEGSDGVETAITTYNYTFARPLGAHGRQCVALAVALIPLAVAEATIGAGRPEHVATIAGLAALTLASLLFWRAQPAILRALRLEVDGTAEEQTWDGDPLVRQLEDEESDAEVDAILDGDEPEVAEDEEEEVTPGRAWAMLLAYTALAWFVTVLAMDPAGELHWLRWGLGGGFTAAEGTLQKACSVVALGWPLALLALLWSQRSSEVAARDGSPSE